MNIYKPANSNKPTTSRAYISLNSFGEYIITDSQTGGVLSMHKTKESAREEIKRINQFAEKKRGLGAWL